MPKKNLIVIVIIMISLMSVYSTQSISKETEHKKSVLIEYKLAITKSNSQHSPITITNNSELANFSTTGNGTILNPYIIENFIINNCTRFGIGINVQNIDKYFVLKNISVLDCFIGFSFSHVKFGTIKESYISNYYFGIQLDFSSNNTFFDNQAYNGSIGFFLKNSTYNNLINNTVNNSNISGFEIVNNANNNSLINNIASNGNVGFNVINSSNTILIRNKAFNNSYYGFSLGTASNTILRYNIGLGNVEDYHEIGCKNTTLNNNKFIIISVNGKSELTYHNFPILFRSINSIVGILFIGIYCGLGLIFYSFKKKKNQMEGSMENHLKKFTSSSMEEQKSKVLITIIGLSSLFLIIFSMFPNPPYISVKHLFSSYLGNSDQYVILSENLLYFSPLSATFFIGGAITTFLSTFIYYTAESFNTYKIAQYFSFIGFITEALGFIMSLVAYYDMSNAVNSDINSIKGISFTSYIITLDIAYFLTTLGIFLVLVTYYLQRRGTNKYVQKINKNSINN